MAMVMMVFYLLVFVARDDFPTERNDREPFHFWHDGTGQANLVGAGM